MCFVCCFYEPKRHMDALVKHSAKRILMTECSYLYDLIVILFVVLCTNAHQRWTGHYDHQDFPWSPGGLTTPLLGLRENGEHGRVMVELAGWVSKETLSLSFPSWELGQGPLLLVVDV